MKKIFFSIPLFYPAFLAAQQGEELPPPPDYSLWQTLTMIAIAIAFFYFILWRPEQKRRKLLDQQRKTLKKGDRAVVMGIIGTVSQVLDHTIILKMHDGSKIEVLKGAITEVTPAKGDGG